MGQVSSSKTPHPSYGDPLQGLPQPVVSLGKLYPDGDVSIRHSHPRHQLIYSVSGLTMAETQSVTWAVPAGYGLVVPAGMFHQIGEVMLESLYLKPNAVENGALDECRIVTVSPLLATLIAEFCALDNPWPTTDKAHHLISLILLELADAPTSPLALPLPTDAKFRRVCDVLMANPALHKTIDHWAYDIGASRRSFTRGFQKQTGLSFGNWTQRLRCQLALQKIASGMAVETAAYEVGYASRYSLEAMMRRLGQPS